MTIRDDIRYVGVNDHDIDLFEGQYVVPRGMAYNSYLVKDEKTLVFDTVDARFGEEWLANIRAEIGDAPVDYLVVQHMEPDHSSNIATFAAAYPKATIVASAQAFCMMKNFFGTDFADRRLVVKEGDSLSTGRHEFKFIAAPMVHWPEVIVTYDATEKVLFSADGFGKFGANDVEDPEGWDCEARRYYIGIVGKYGPQTQALLKKAAGLEISTICPLHGPVLSTPEEIAHVVKQYDTWSSYSVESPGICICYTSVYGHTKAAVMKLKELLLAKGCPKVAVSDLARDDPVRHARPRDDDVQHGRLPVDAPFHRPPDGAQLPEAPRRVHRERLVGAQRREGDEGHVREVEGDRVRRAGRDDPLGAQRGLRGAARGACRRASWVIRVRAGAMSSQQRNEVGGNGR